VGVHKVRSIREQGIAEIHERRVLPESRSRMSERGQNGDAHARLPASLERRTVGAGNDRDLVPDRQLSGRQLDDVGLGTADVTLSDHVDDPQRHQPTASNHAASHASYE
jgi:hypothetical protein